MRTKMLQVLLPLLLLYAGTAINAQTHEVTNTVALPLPPSSLLPTEAPITTGRVPLQPGKFSPCWGSTITNSLTWDILTTTFTNLTVVPHITPFANGTNSTSYETITPQEPAPTHFLSTTMANGSVCVAPTPCVEQLAQGCGSLRERQLFVAIDSTGSAGSTPFTNPSTYITATSLFETAYTAPPKIEATVDPSTTALQAPQPAPPPAVTVPQSKPPIAEPASRSSSSPGDNNSPQPNPSRTQVHTKVPVRVIPPVISSLLSDFAPAGWTAQATPTIFEASVSDNPRPGSEIKSQTTAIATSVPTGTIDLPKGFSILPSRSGIVLPNGQTLEPGSATTVNSVPVSLAPSAIFIAISGTRTIPLVPDVTQDIVFPNGETLKPGELTTILGVPVSLSPGNTRVIIDGSNIVLVPTVTDDIGSYIWSGIGVEATSSILPYGKATSLKPSNESPTSLLPLQPTGGASPKILAFTIPSILFISFIEVFFS